jgi:putative ABC transport system permease protein
LLLRPNTPVEIGPDLYLQVIGVATGMFLFTTIETMQSSLRSATQSTANDTTLIVFRENRFCPSTSRLPEYYESEIKRIDGVTEVIPVQILVNNCGTSLDVVVFRGIPSSKVNALSEKMHFLMGPSPDGWNVQTGLSLVLIWLKDAD